MLADIYYWFTKVFDTADLKDARGAAGATGASIIFSEPATRSCGPDRRREWHEAIVSCLDGNFHVIAQRIKKRSQWERTGTLLKLS
jgi:hypothetical protein